MCGGRGTRLDADAEKPLFEVAGAPMVDRVADALAASGLERAHAVVSPHAPETRAHVSAREDLAVVETPGEGYVADLRTALDRVGTPALTVAADLPVLDGAAVDRVRDAFDGRSVTVCVPAALKRRLGASADTTFERDGRALAPAGINVVADASEETIYETYDARFALNVNRRSDADLAETLLGGADGPR
ncbi:NTP transferase domain-containing protein [Halorussus marinus]|uniref:NTP transferase domain-containing protein n=1 Tax=Halorussus marinus TaxID=2505976 RepID=UPI001AD979C7|nr:NTP transferase domain-containing protein [Halorussus marinus]